MEGYSEDQQSLSQTGGFLSSSATAGATPSTPGKRPTSIRPLTAAYQASANQHQVSKRYLTGNGRHIYVNNVMYCSNTDMHYCHLTTVKVVLVCSQYPIPHSISRINTYRIVGKFGQN